MDGMQLKPTAGPQPLPQVGTTETYSQNILGPVYFELYDLRVEGQTTPSQPPHPENSPYIISSNEDFTASVKVKFNNSPLTRLLLCLKTKIHICFSFEGVGAKATELDLSAWIETEKDVFEYTITYEGTPDAAGLTSGFYAIAAVAEIGPGNHPCAQYVFGYGYVAGVLLQVYKAFV
ncbi:hypothetical protein [Lyngbya aestuarii]|uniref:hypothetical protein n=1 Tax=Lyngbya aestuarii TaxID=118322 RepID=UPI00403E2D5A